MKFFSELDTPLTGAIILLDIDGTLVCEGGDCMEEKSLACLKKLAKKNEIYLCSNSPNKTRNRRFAKKYGLKLIDTPLRKPSAEILKLVPNSKKKPLVVLGNLAWTDGRLARNIGGTFIHVKTICGANDSLYDRLLYAIDRFLYARFL